MNMKKFEKEKKIELYSKKRYILIDKETNTPLLYKDNGRWNRKSFLVDKNSSLDVYTSVAVFEKQLPLNELAFNTKTNEYQFIPNFSSIRHKNYKLYKDFINAKNKVVWKRLPKNIRITRIESNDYNMSDYKEKLKIINIKK